MDIFDGNSGLPADQACASKQHCEIAPPEKLDGREKKIWRHICEGLAAEGRLKQKDSVAIYRICRAWVLWQDARRIVDKVRRGESGLIMTTPNGYRQIDAAVAAERSLGKDLDECLDAMGLNMTAFAPANLRFVQAERLANQMDLFAGDDSPIDAFIKQQKELDGAHVH